MGLMRRTVDALGLGSREPTSLDLRAAADGASAPAPSDGGYYVPANTTWSQILDYTSGTARRLAV